LTRFGPVMFSRTWILVPCGIKFASRTIASEYINSTSLKSQMVIEDRQACFRCGAWLLPAASPEGTRRPASRRHRQPASRERPGTSGRRPSTARGGIGSLHCALQGVSVGSFESHLGFASLPGATVTYRPAVTVERRATQRMAPSASAFSLSRGIWLPE